MKPHRILKSFRGSQDGIHTRHFRQGAVELLSDSLAKIVVKDGRAEPYTESPAESRETKVVAPEEAKEPKKTLKLAKRV